MNQQLAKDNTLGWISVHRKIQTHWLYPKEQNRKFTQYEAWQDLLLSVSHKPIKHVVNGELVNVPCGGFVVTETSLSNRWLWCRKTVRKFLRLLVSEKMVTLEKINPKSRKSCTILKLNNYLLYQDISAVQVTKKIASNATTETMTKVSHNNNDNNLNNNEDYLKILERKIS